MRLRKFKLRLLSTLIIAGVAGFSTASPSFGGNTPETCLECHSDTSLVSERNHRRSVYVDKSKFDRSVHGKLNCIECHRDADVSDFPHPVPLKPVDCALCHVAENKEYRISRHAETASKPNLPGATCIACHGTHDILPSSDPNSPSNALNVPKTCGMCHNEEGRVPMNNGIPENISFTDGIHARGLEKRGIKITAVCTSCHGAHAILRYSDPRSSISRENSAATCQKCHTNLEFIHQKVIKRGLWRSTKNSYPVCVDCHDPHKGFEHSLSRADFSDRSCMKCHDDTASAEGLPTSLLVHGDQLKKSAHSNLPCVQCHVDVSVKRSPVCIGSEKVNCGSCHAEIAEKYESSIHGELHAEADKDAPACTDCHGDHGIQKKDAENSPISRMNSPELCGKCHKVGRKAAVRDTTNKGMWEKYKISVHGEGLEKGGLTVTAICVDCHTTHEELPGSDTASSVNRKHIVATCTRCHQGVYTQFVKSVHSPTMTITDKKLPVCSDCHPLHNIIPVEGNAFRQQIMIQCGGCHKDVAKTYFMTYHGKGSRLGSSQTAKCSDCHGAHDIHRIEDPDSPLSKENIVATCKKCHPKARAGFGGFLAHASPEDRTKYPLLFFTFWGMNLLLIGTFSFFGMHTLMWLPRSFRERLREQRKLTKRSSNWVRRFPPFYRFLHLFVIISFLGLALTGMTIKFSDERWALILSQFLGGIEVSRFIHRVCAIITFGYFGFHVVEMIMRLRREKQSIWKFLFLNESMIPTKRDLIEFGQTIKWFLKKGPRPQYGRWTYWEKFDYFAVFWGVAIIGSTGLVLWFPEFFTMILPGWAINIAMVIHSDEALLAVGFIFTIHFFNTHFRPEKFPMDTVIFTGKVPLEVFKEERPREYEQLVKENKMGALFEPPPSKTFMIWARIFGTLALTTGILLIGLVIWAMVLRHFFK